MTLIQTVFDNTQFLLLDDEVRHLRSHFGLNPCRVYSNALMACCIFESLYVHYYDYLQPIITIAHPVACLSVCLSVAYIDELCKNGLTVQDAI